MQSFTTLQIVSLVGLLGTVIWGFGYTVFALVTNKVKSPKYKVYLTLSLLIYMIYITIHLCYLYFEYDPVLDLKTGPLLGFRSITSSFVFLGAVGLDSLVLQLFGVLDHRITPKRLNILRFSFFCLFVISIIFAFLNVFITQSTTMYTLQRFSKIAFIVSVCLYDEIQNIFVTLMVYRSLATYSKASSSTLQKTFYLICITYPIDIIGAICFLLGETMTPTSPFYKFKFEIVNGSVMAVGIHLNFMVMLFCGLVNLTFSAKGGIYSKNKPTSVKEATRRTNH